MTSTRPLSDVPARAPALTLATGPHLRGWRRAGPVLAGHLRELATAGLRQQLTTVVSPGEDLVLDLSQVQSVDAGVVGVLLAADRRLRPTGAHVVLTGVQPRVARALGVAGAEHLLG